MVEVQKLRTFYDFSWPRPSAEIRVVEVQKLGTFYDFCWPHATLCGDSRGRVVRAQPSAEIRVVEVQKLRTFYDFCWRARDPLRGSCVSKRSRCGAVRICPSLGEPSAEIARVEALSLWRRAFFLLAKRPLEVALWFARLLSQSRGRGFDSPLVRGSSGLKIAAFKYKRSTRSRLLQLRLENRNF